jgi:hypothetical protein
MAKPRFTDRFQEKRAGFGLWPAGHREILAAQPSNVLALHG